MHHNRGCRKVRFGKVSSSSGPGPGFIIVMRSNIGSRTYTFDSRLIVHILPSWRYWSRIPVARWSDDDIVDYDDDGVGDGRDDHGGDVDDMVIPMALRAIALTDEDDGDGDDYADRDDEYWHYWSSGAALSTVGLHSHSATGMPLSVVSAPFWWSVVHAVPRKCLPGSIRLGSCE